MKTLAVLSVTLAAGTVGLVILGVHHMAVWFAEAIELGLEDLA